MRGDAVPRLRSALARGYSIVELMMVCAVILVLAAAIVPVTRFQVQRQKELEL